MQLIHETAEELLSVVLLKAPEHGMEHSEGLKDGTGGGVAVGAGGIAPNFVDQLPA